jgi:hypothetical protein
VKRYAVPAVLIAWAFSVAAGGGWTGVWTVLLIAAVVVQVAGLAESYRDHRHHHHGRWWS